MKTTTLNKIREYRPCEDGWEKLLKHLGKTKAVDAARDAQAREFRRVVVEKE